MSIEEELENLAAAFPPRPLDPDAAFREWGGTYLDAASFQRDARGKTWPELAPAFLEHHHDALVFFGPSSIGDYLPAYVAALLRREPGPSALPQFLLDVLHRDYGPDRFDQRFAQLQPAQRAAIARALAAAEIDTEGMPRQRAITAALDSYWRGLLEPNGG